MRAPEPRSNTAFPSRIVPVRRCQESVTAHLRWVVRTHRSNATCLVLRPTQQLRSLAMFAAIRRASSRVCR